MNFSILTLSHQKSARNAVIELTKEPTATNLKTDLPIDTSKMETTHTLEFNIINRLIWILEYYKNVQAGQ